MDMRERKIKFRSVCCPFVPLLLNSSSTLPVALYESKLNRVLLLEQRKSDILSSHASNLLKKKFGLDKREARERRTRTPVDPRQTPACIE
jgi:hypothetical protein